MKILFETELVKLVKSSETKCKTFLLDFDSLQFRVTALIRFSFFDISGGGLGGFFGGKIFNVDSDRLDKSSILNSAVNNRNSINSDNRDDRDNRDISRSAQIDDRRNDDRRDDRSDISRDDRIRIDDGGQRGSTLADTLSNY